MPHDGFHLGDEECVPTGVVMELFQFVDQLWTTFDPSVQGLDRRFRIAAWLVEQSQFGLAVRTENKHGESGVMSYEL